MPFPLSVSSVGQRAKLLAQEIARALQLGKNKFELCELSSKPGFECIEALRQGSPLFFDDFNSGIQGLGPVIQDTVTVEVGVEQANQVIGKTPRKVYGISRSHRAAKHLECDTTSRSGASQNLS